MADQILESLRKSTAKQHAALEAEVDIVSRLKNADRYANLLEIFLGWYEPMERAFDRLSGWDAYGFSPGARRKAAWLVQDLQALGRPAEQIAALPRCQSIPALTTLGCGFGCAYVVEGSTLGGRHIAAMMRDSLIPLEARRFFTSYGTEVGTRWKEFLSSLDAFAETTSARQDIITGACDAFSSMQDWVATAGAPAR